jgi:hypothetical protein
MIKHIDALPHKGAEEARNRLPELLAAAEKGSRPSSPGTAGRWRFWRRSPPSARLPGRNR